MSVLFDPSSKRSALGQPANNTRWKARLHMRTFWVVWCRELNTNWFQGSHVQKKRLWQTSARRLTKRITPPKNKKRKRFDSSELIVSTSYPHSRADPTGVSHPWRLASCSPEEGFCVWLLRWVKTSSYLRFPPRPSQWLCHCDMNTAAKRALCPFG